MSMRSIKMLYDINEEVRLPETIELELAKIFKASQEKYIYFMLAAAASAIGFAMTQSKVEPLNFTHIPLGLSIVLWAVSFVAGLRFLQYSGNVTFQNQNYLAFKRELKKYQARDAAELISLFKSQLNDTLYKQNKKMKFYGSLQNQSLLFGALAYITWHGARMWALNV